MFKIEKARPAELNVWQDPDANQAIDRAKASLVAPGDTVTVTDQTTGETVWMAVIGRDGRRHEWDGKEPRQVSVSPNLELTT